MLRASILKSHTLRPPNQSSHPSRNNHLTPTAHAPPSRGEALRPRGFYHRLRDEKSLVYWLILTRPAPPAVQPTTQDTATPTADPEILTHRAANDNYCPWHASTFAGLLRSTNRRSCPHAPDTTLARGGSFWRYGFCICNRARCLGRCIFLGGDAVGCRGRVWGWGVWPWIL